MGDPSVPAIDPDVEPAAAKGGLVKGDDGQLSGRKIIGLGAAVSGVGCGGWAIATHADWKLTLVVMGLCFLVTIVMYGFLTAQNVRGLIASWKGVSG